MRIVRINMTDLTIKEEDFRQEDYGYLGGRGLVDEIITAKELDPKCDPLGPDNILSFATGLFAGTIMTTSGRLSVCGKSPLTGGIKESNAGGTFGRWMSEQSLKMISVYGAPTDGKLRLVVVDENGNFTFEDAEYLKMQKTYATCDMLRDRFGKDCSIACVGPGAERMSVASGVFVTEYETGYPCRAAARGGMGAVMASKGLKAIVLKKSANPFRPTIPAGFEEKFHENAVACSKAVTTSPMTGGLQRNCGSAAGVGATGKMGALPVNNFSGKMVDYSRLAPDAWVGEMKSQGGFGVIPCQPGCVCCCSNDFYGKDRTHLSAGIEYETLVFMGTNIGIWSPTFVATGDRFCDEYGIDTIDIGNGIACAMDCGVLEFGDEEGTLELFKKIEDPDDEFGRVLLNGCQAVADYLHAKRVPTVKRQSLAAYDPRVIEGFGMTFERSPMGADHTSSAAATYRADLSPEDQVDFSQAMSACCDDFDICLFAWGSIFPKPDSKMAITKAAMAFCGKEETEEDAVGLCEKIGRHILEIEHKFNRDAGFTMEDDRLGDFFYTEPAEATGKPYVSRITRSFLDVAEERGGYSL